MARFSDKDRRLAVGVIMVVLVMMPVFFIYSQAVQIIDSHFEQTLANVQLSLKAELREFKSDLIPKSRINKLIKQVEREAGLVWKSDQQPVFRGDADPQVYDSQTLTRLMDSFQRQAEVKPIALVVAEYNLREIYSWFDNEKLPLKDDDRWLLTNGMALDLARTIDAVSVINNPDFDRVSKWLNRVQAGYKNTNEAIVCILQKYFSHMAFRLPTFLDCHEMITHSFGAQRLFMYLRPIVADDVFLGGFFVVFSNLAFPPEKLIANAVSSSTEGFERKMHSKPQSDDENQYVMKLNDLTPAQFSGYGLMHDQVVPGYISVSYDYVAEAQQYENSKKLLADLTRLIFVLSVFAALAFWHFSFPASWQLRGQMTATIAVVMLMPYILMGSISVFLLYQLDNLRRYEIVSHGRRHIHELGSFHQDQKLQQLLQLMRFKLHLSQYIDDSVDALTHLPAHAVVPADGNVQLAMVRFDGFARAFRSRYFSRLMISNLDSIIGVRYLDALGVLDRSSDLAQSTLRLADYTHAFLQQLVENNFEYYNMLHESTEVRQMSKVDDYSRMTFHLVTSASDTELIRGIVFQSLAYHNSMVFNPRTYTHSIFTSDSNLVNHSYALGRMMSNNSVNQWWPAALHQDSERVQLLFSAAKTRSTGLFAWKGEGNEQILHNWRFLKNDLMVAAGVTSSRPDPIMKLAVRVLPLLLFSLALITIFLFSDVLSALLIKPVAGFIEAFKLVERGNYNARIKIAATDEFSDLADSFNSMALNLAQREKMRRFVSDRLFNDLGKEGGLASIDKAQQAFVTILASDIRSFTSISEKYDPEEIVSLLNEYFTRMEAAIVENGGFIEKFVGDAVSAVFYHDQGRNGAINAINAAVAMRKELAELNSQRCRQNLFTIENGIGIASGVAISGITGSESGRMVFTVLGEVSTCAETLEAATTCTSKKILVCPVTVDHAQKYFRFIPVKLALEQLAFEPGESADV